jgi:hypothetical protein
MLASARLVVLSFLFASSLLAAANSIAGHSGRKEDGDSFHNNVVSFWLPKDWKCYQDQDTELCQPSDKIVRQAYIIAVNSKPLKPGKDEMANYKARLGIPHPFTALSGARIVPEVRYVRDRKIGGHSWIESLQFNQDIPDFFETSLVAETGEFVVLVTISVHKNKYAEFQNEQERIIESLRTSP